MWCWGVCQWMSNHVLSRQGLGSLEEQRGWVSTNKTIIFVLCFNFIFFSGFFVILTDLVQKCVVRVCCVCSFLPFTMLRPYTAPFFPTVLPLDFFLYLLVPFLFYFIISFFGRLLSRSTLPPALLCGFLGAFKNAVSAVCLACFRRENRSWLTMYTFVTSKFSFKFKGVENQRDDNIFTPFELDRCCVLRPNRKTSSRNFASTNFTYRISLTSLVLNLR